MELDSPPFEIEHLPLLITESGQWLGSAPDFGNIACLATEFGLFVVSHDPSEGAVATPRASKRVAYCLTGLSICFEQRITEVKASPQ